MTSCSQYSGGSEGRNRGVEVVQHMEKSHPAEEVEAPGCAGM